MKIKKLEIEDYIKLQNFLKENIPNSDNILIDIPNHIPNIITDIVLRVYTIDKNLQNRINFVINNDENASYLKILDGDINVKIIKKIQDYIKQNLITKINIII